MQTKLHWLFLLLYHSIAVTTRVKREVFPKHQRNANIQCYRPSDLDYIGQPVVLYHEVFSQFLRDCSTIEVDIEICKEVLSFVKFFQKGINGSPQNNGYIFGSKVINKINIDIPIVIHDIKNEIFTGKWEEKPKKYKAILNISACPAFLLYLAGPWLCISDSVKVDNLINMISIVPIMDFTQLTQIARIFTALRKSFRSLIDYCTNLQPKPYDVDTKIYFLFPTTFNDVPFTYISYIQPLVLTAEANNQKIIIKFVQ
ncbi:17623_t:CDS:2 [Funneliformis caledonium]|uniref:17623_t:CDS:1 n=1 Tax=Funneliformis caledonium TaxID=1117310 RepID=A0A9N9F024_9GLOM|nr:17623_t:CDS:2 [Funneliformis caledonium]